MTTDPKQLVLAACVELLRLADEGKVPGVHSGICHNVDCVLWRGRTDDDSYEEAWEFFNAHVTEVVWPHWPKFSGAADYPIPGGKDVYWSLPMIGHWKGEQGELRRELLQFTIEQLNEEVKP